MKGLGEQKEVQEPDQEGPANGFKWFRVVLSGFKRFQLASRGFKWFRKR